MPRFIRVPLSIELLLLSIEHAIPQSSAVLPLGGTSFAQLACLLLVGIAMAEIEDCRKRP